MELVSILIPAFNSSHFIRDTIASALKQTYKNIEIVIIDDFSKDKTASIILDEQSRDNRIKFFANNKNKGNSFTKYRCIKESKGVFLFFLDHDDLFEEDKIEKQVAAIKTSKCNWVGSFGKELNELTKEISNIGQYDPQTDVITQILQNRFRVPMCSIGIRSSTLKNKILYKVHERCFNSSIGFDHTQLLVQMAYEPFEVLRESLCIYRRHDTNLSDSSEYTKYHSFNMLYLCFLLFIKSKDHRKLNVILLMKNYITILIKS